MVGDAPTLEQAVAGCGLDLRVAAVDGPEAVSGRAGTVEVLDLADAPSPLRHGEVDAACGRAAIDSIEGACRLALEGRVDAIVTGPVNKQALRAAGSPFPGHTEMLASLLGVEERDVLTMFVVERLRIFFLTRHHPLRDAIDLIDVDGVHAQALRVHAQLEALGIEHPSIALAALNPHAGDGGLLGREEGDVLEPAVARARADGVDLRGPIPADSVFWQARQGEHDAVLSLYHDQGHVAAKTVSFFGTVSCTLGLPVIRTAAEHGTAFPIAGRWIADPGGQVGAMRVAVELVRGARRADPARA